MPPEPFVVLHYTESCNASCAHCIVESGPSRKGRIPMASAMAAIRGASLTPGMRMIVFSGGESFFYLSDVLELCRQAKGLGLSTRIISNGYWGRSPEASARMLERLADGNVDELVISFDEFHTPFIAPQKIRNVLAGAASAATSPWVVYSAVVVLGQHSSGDLEVVDGSPWPSPVTDLLERYGFEIGRCVSLDDAQARLRVLTGDARELLRRTLKRECTIVNWQPLAIGGRATRELPGRLHARAIEEFPGNPCEAAGRQITIPTSGRAYPCCSLWTNFGEHNFGEVNDVQGFADACRKIQEDPLVRLIRDEGPGQLVRWLRARGYAVRDTYTDMCNMCEEVLSRFPLATLQAEANRCAQEQLLDTLIGAAGFETAGPGLRASADDRGARANAFAGEPLPTP